MPKFYPIPDDGTVGEMLKASARHPYRPAHVHFMIVADGHETLVTHVFVDGDQYLDSDAVFAVKNSLIRDFTREAPGVAPDGKKIDTPWRKLHSDFVLSKGSGEEARTDGVGCGTARPTVVKATMKEGTNMATLDLVTMPRRGEHPRKGWRRVGVSRTRVPVSAIFENLKTSPLEEVLENFHVTRDQVQTVLDFAARSTLETSRVG